MSKSTGFVLSIGLFGCVLLGCQKAPAPGSAASPPSALKPPSTQPPAAGVGGSPDAPPLRAEAGNRKMANCPSSVEGASTTIGETEGAVVVTVTAPAEGATGEIRSRAKHLVEVSKRDPAEIRHTGEGEGGGGLGSCPVVLADTTLAVEEVPGGAKVTVKPSRPEDLEKLRIATRDRHSKAAASK